AAKRLIGRQYDSPQVQHAIQSVAYQLVEGAAGEVRIILRGQQHTVPEISAMLLQEMRVIAEEYLQEEVDQAVVTVPAYFQDAQRQAVRDAGLIAGLDVLRIINEPTAAALAYGYGKGLDQTIAVYDLGGGTFDISVVRVEDGNFNVIASTGDSYLGGEDFDDRIMAWLIRGFEVQNSVDLRESPIALQRLKQAAQKAKCELSSVEKTEIQLPFIVSSGPSGPIHMHYGISRPQLEKLTADLVQRTLEICERAMEMAEKEPADIDDVILVGGMTRMPAVQETVAEFFGIPPNKGVHPDEVVALGAALQGAALVDEIDDVALEDVTAHSLGIATAGDRFEVLIPPATKVPCRLPKDFTTSRPNQERLKIVVLQGESIRASENDILQDFALTGLRPAPAGELDVEVAFVIDEDGIFSVSAKDLETGEETTVEVASESVFEEGELERLSQESREYLQERRAEEAAERIAQGLQSLLAELDRLFLQADRWLSGNPTALITLTHARHAHEQAAKVLKEGERREIAEHVVILEDAKGMVERLLKESDAIQR
ncbi:MAG: Hsp70 family protein, partial [Myxococcota bacterium]